MKVTVNTFQILLDQLSEAQLNVRVTKELVRGGHEEAAKAALCDLGFQLSQLRSDLAAAKLRLFQHSQ